LGEGVPLDPDEERRMATLDALLEKSRLSLEGEEGETGDDEKNKNTLDGRLH